MASTKKPQQSKSAHNQPQAASYVSNEAALLLSSPQPSSRADKLYQQFVHNVSQVIKPSSIKPPTVLIGLSGGLDSCVLLHMLHRWAGDGAVSLHATHVHHGISKNADDWTHFCEQLCHQYSVPLRVVRVKLTHATGMGVEAEARALRYEALLNSAHDYVMVAHHQDDQAETLLLQLLRGAGVRGLSSMAAYNAEQRLLRPLLNLSRDALAQYAQAHQLQWVEDESNLQERYDRNFIRQRIMPILNTRYPQVQYSLARVASHMAEAQALVDDLALMDAKICIDNQRLLLAPLLSLSLIRQKNLIRWWLHQQHILMPSATKLESILVQLRDAKADANVQVVLDTQQGLVLRRYQGAAYICKQPSGRVKQPLQWRGEDSLQLADGSILIFSYQQGQGLDVSKLNSQLTIAYRAGGERFKPDAARPTRTLKHLLQEANIPPWQRERLPLIYVNDKLAVVPMVGVACNMHAKAGEKGLVISWVN